MTMVRLRAAAAAPSWVNEIAPSEHVYAEANVISL